MQLTCYFIVQRNNKDRRDAAMCLAMLVALDHGVPLVVLQHQGGPTLQYLDNLAFDILMAHAAPDKGAQLFKGYGMRGHAYTIPG